MLYGWVRMSHAAIIQYCVAALAAAGGVYVLTRPAADEPAVYRRRIAGTMMLAFGLALAVLATGLQFGGSLR